MNQKIKIILSSIVLPLLLTACNDWLDVTSKTEIPSDVHFNSASGFKDAVIGVYVKMAKPELYGKTLSWHVNEFVSQNYAVVAGARDLNVPKYLYESTPWVDYRNSIWKNCYEVVANINNVLRHAEQGKGVMSPILDSLVRGELLGLRALMHFDLLRMFGKGNLGERPEVLEEYGIPYSFSFEKYPPKQVTYGQYMEYLKADIEEAVSYLWADPYTGREEWEYYASDIDNSFLVKNEYDQILDRNFRLNYWAAKALQARILMWEGTPEAKSQACKIAEELIENAPYVWASEGGTMVKNGEWWKSDLLFRAEHLFTLAVEKLANYQANWFDASSPNSTYNVVFLTQEKAEEIYESPGCGDSDWRFTECLLRQGPSMNNYGLAKLRQHPDHAEVCSRMIPMIRITEMFYIAAECHLEKGGDYDKGLAIGYLNLVRSRRGIAEADKLPGSLTDEEVQHEILKEYRKEFVGEGQVFFYYKRKGMEIIPGRLEVMTDAQYQYPMPDDEVVLGGRIVE